MFFFIGGVQPKTKALDAGHALCPACGRPGLRLFRTDHYLSLFFIPLIPVKRGVPYYACESCGAVFDEARRPAGPGRAGPSTCRFCGRRLDDDFEFCPSCGRPVGEKRGPRFPARY